MGAVISEAIRENLTLRKSVNLQKFNPLHQPIFFSCNWYRQQNSNMAVYAKMSIIHIYMASMGNPQAEGNVKLGFHKSASLTAVS